MAFRTRHEASRRRRNETPGFTCPMGQRHHHPSTEAERPTDAMNNPSPDLPDDPPPPPWQPPLYHPPPPDEPPPSYHDATHSETSPLLVGPPPDYGIFRAYPEPDEDSSVASSEIEATDRTLPEWAGQIIVVSMFVAICYGFWRLAMDFPDLSGQPP